MSGIRRALFGTAACVAMLAWGAGGAGAATPDSFQVRSAQDLAALCGADPGDANYVAAIHFCHGFVVGALQYYRSVIAANPAGKFICAPEPAPTRSQAIAAFVSWAQRNPQHMTESATDAMFRYLGQTYPCTRS